MHVVIVGCGRVGSSLARELHELGHSIAVIDKRPEAFERFLGDWPGTTVVGFGFDRDRLQEAGIERADALAAVTNGDNSNIMVARIGKETYQVPRVVARIYDPRRAGVYQRLGIPTVATVGWTTDRALRRLLPDETRAEWVDPTGGVAVAERALPISWVGRRLGDLDQADRWRLVALTRAGKATLADPTLLIQEGDIATVCVEGGSLAAFDEHLDAGAGGHRS